MGVPRALRRRTPQLSRQECTAQWLRGLREKGFVLDENGEALDCAETRSALRRLLESVLPSARIFTITAHDRGDGQCALHSVEVYVHDLRELHALPAVAAD